MTKLKRAEIKIRSLETKLKEIKDDVDFRIKVVDRIIETYVDGMKRNADEKWGASYISNLTSKCMAELEKKSLKELYSKF